jgi:hypothetical protein
VTENEHTPGPWKVGSSTPDGSRVVAIAPIAWCGANSSFSAASQSISAKQALANARLIAASPDLLEALEMVRDADDDCKMDGLPTIPGPARARIDAAIAKAKGQA